MNSTEELTIRPMDEAARQSAMSIAAQFDGIAFALVKERLPGEDIRLPGQLRGRIEAFEYLPPPGQTGYTEYRIDGKPFVRFWPPEMEWEGLKMTVTQRYQVLT